MSPAGRRLRRRRLAYHLAAYLLTWDRRHRLEAEHYWHVVAFSDL